MSEKEMSMKRIVAVNKLSKILGKRMGYRIDPKALMADEKEAVKADFQIEAEALNELKRKKRERFEALLKADAAYQSLANEWRAVEDRVNKLRSKLHGYKITVGLSDRNFFYIKAEGDSWEEVLAKLS
jgi:hypothetical protein